MLVRPGGLAFFHSIKKEVNPDAYIRLVTVCLMEYAEDWSVSRAYVSAQSLQDLAQTNRLTFLFYRNPFCEHPLTRAFIVAEDFLVGIFNYREFKLAPRRAAGQAAIGAV